MAYKSRFTGNEIDDAIGQVRSNSTSWSGKQDKLTGANGQVVGFDALGNAVAQNIPQSSGVSSFNGRTGAVTPQTGDYTAVMVGAAPAGTGVPTGGTTNQVLAKNSNTDNDLKWVDMTSGPSGTTDHSQLTNRDIASQHPATSIDFTPTANVTSTNVQDAIDEVGTDRVTAVGGAQIVNIPASFGPPPYTITFTDDDDGGSEQASGVEYDNTSSGMQSTNVQDAIDELFTDVGDGKALVASAVTDKGVATAPDATWQTIASNIRSISGFDEYRDLSSQQVSSITISEKIVIVFPKLYNIVSGEIGLSLKDAGGTAIRGYFFRAASMSGQGGCCIARDNTSGAFGFRTVVSPDRTNNTTTVTIYPTNGTRFDSTYKTELETSIDYFILCSYRPGLG